MRRNRCSGMEHKQTIENLVCLDVQLLGIQVLDEDLVDEELLSVQLLDGHHEVLANVVQLLHFQSCDSHSTM